MGLQSSSTQPGSAQSGKEKGSHALSADLEGAANTEGGTYIQPPAEQRINQPEGHSSKPPSEATGGEISLPGGVTHADAVTAVVAGLDANARPLEEKDYQHFCEGVEGAHKMHEPTPAAGKPDHAERNRNVRAQGALQQPSGTGNH